MTPIEKAALLGAGLTSLWVVGRGIYNRWRWRKYRIPGSTPGLGSRFTVRENVDNYRVATVAIGNAFSTKVWPLFTEVLPQHQRMVLAGLKVDTAIPYPALGCFWIKITIQDRCFEFPCSAFDRSVPTFKVKQIADSEFVAVDLKPAMFKLPLLVNEQAYWCAELVFKGDETLVLNESLTVTFIAIVSRPVA